MPEPASLRAAWRLLRGELRRPDPLLLATWLALAAGVAALAGVGTLAQRVDRALLERGAQMLGGDVKVTAQRDLRALAAALPAALQPTATVLELPTMAAAGERLMLAELKAVDAGWPVLGALEVEPAAQATPPPSNAAYVDAMALSRLGIKVGDTLDLGSASFTVAGVIRREPDRLAGAFSLGPRVLIAAAALPATQLVQPLSRVRSELLYRAAPGQAEALARRLREALPGDVRVSTAREGLETTRGLLGQAQDFLRLVAAAGLLVAVAAATAVDSLLARRAPTVAILKALGAPRRAVLLAYGGLLGALALAAGLGGALTGAGLAELAAWALGDALPADLPPAGAQPALVALVAAAALTAAIGGPALARLRARSAVEVLRASQPGERGLSGAALGMLLALAAGGALLAALSTAPQVTLGVYGGLMVIAAALLALAFGASRALAAVARGPLVWRHACASLARAPGATTLAVAALALAVLATLAPALLGRELLAQWSQRVPANAPNRFLIDVQPEQRDGVARVLADHGAREVWLRPVVRARLTTINGQPPREGSDERGQRFAQREQNLTWTEHPEPGNRIAAGRWPMAGTGPAEVAVETDFAERLGIVLGTRLGFDIGGVALEARVTGLREVSWESLRSNFFLVFGPGALEPFPATWVSSFRIEQAQSAALERALVRAYPNPTVLDLTAIRAALQELVTRLSQGTGVLSGAAALAAAAVLLASVLAQRAQLRRETALLRSLGAGRAWLRTLLAVRFALPGALAGVLGVLAAWAGGAGASVYWLELSWRPSLTVLLVTPLATAALAAAVGALGARGVLRAAPVAILRSR